jgi:hypothetical protein
MQNVQQESSMLSPLLERARPVALIAAIVVATTSIAGGAAQRATGAAQRKDNSELSRPGWLTLRIADVVKATPAERAILTARWAEYDRLFITQESLVRPQGFTVGPYATSLWSLPFVLHLDYGYVFFKGVRTTRGEGSVLLGVVENPSAKNVSVVERESAFRDSQGDIYAERPRHSPPSGIPANAFVFDALQIGSTNETNENQIRVVLTSAGELPWSDVPRERVLNILIAEAQEDTKRVEQYARDSSYQKWLQGAPARQREREQILAAMAGVAGGDKAQLAKAREDFEQVERQTGESMKADDAAQRELVARQLAAAKGRLTQLTGELAAMSAAERAMPAWIRLTNQATYEFAAPGTPESQHLIADKPDFYRSMGSRVQMRALLISFRLTNGTDPQMDRAVADSYNAFDWAAAARMLSASTK